MTQMLVFLLFVSAGVLIDGVFFPVSIFKSHVQDVTKKGLFTNKSSWSFLNLF